MFGHGNHLAAGPAGGDRHVVADGGFAREVDDDDVLGFVFLELPANQGEKLVG